MRESECFFFLEKIDDFESKSQGWSRMFLKRGHVFFTFEEMARWGLESDQCTLVFVQQRPGGKLVKKKMSFVIRAPEFWGFPQGFVETFLQSRTPDEVRGLTKGMLDCTTLGLPLKPGIKFQGSLLRALKQDIAVKNVVDRLKNSLTHSATLSLPCGWGKTACALAVISLMGRKAFILVHTRLLASQWEERILTFLPGSRVKVMEGSSDFENAPGTTDVVIGLMQSLAKVPQEVQMSNRFSSFGILVVDEAHHAPCASIRSAMLCFGATFTLGLTATPYRQDGLTDFIKWSCGMPALVIPPRFLDCEIHAVDFERTKKVKQSELVLAGIGGTTLVDQLACSEERNEFICDLAVKAARALNCGILVVTSRRAHAEALHNGVRSVMGDKDTGLIMGGSEEGISTRETGEQAKGRPHVIVSTMQMVCEGFDRGSSLRGLVLASPRSHSSESTWLVQTVGRVCRAAASGAKGASSTSVVYDIVDKNISSCKTMYRQRKTGYQRFGCKIVK